MKIGKIALLMFVLCSLFAFSISLGTAADPTTIEDPEDDVINMLSYQQVTNKPNVDIKELTYTNDENRVTLTLEVFGRIENRGDIYHADLYVDDVNVVVYSFNIQTSNSTYIIDYINESCNITYGTFPTTSSNWSVDNDILTIYFDTLDDGETLTYFDCYASDFIVSGTDEVYEAFFDFATTEDIPLFIDAGVEYQGNVSEEITFDAFAMGVPPYTYSWDFGDGTTGNGQNVTHAYDQARDYIATLTVTDSTGAVETDTATVTITGENGGNGGDNGGDTTDSNILLFGGVILVIAIIGIIAVVIIIRR